MTGRRRLSVSRSEPAKRDRGCPPRWAGCSSAGGGGLYAYVGVPGGRMSAAGYLGKAASRLRLRARYWILPSLEPPGEPFSICTWTYSGARTRDGGSLEAGRLVFGMFDAQPCDNPVIGARIRGGGWLGPRSNGRPTHGIRHSCIPPRRAAVVRPHPHKGVRLQKRSNMTLHMAIHISHARTAGRAE